VPLVRICAGGDQRWSSLPRHRGTSFACLYELVIRLRGTAELWAYRCISMSNTQTFAMLAIKDEANAT
jgi:hypothetical protein